MTTQQIETVHKNLGLAFYAYIQMCKYVTYDETLKEDLESIAKEQLCFATVTYDETRGTFSAYAYKKIHWALYKFLRKEMLKGMSISNNVSFRNEVIPQFESYDTIEFNKICDYERYVYTYSMIELISELSVPEKVVLDGLQKGYSIREISDMVGVSINSTRKVVKSLRSKTAYVFDYQHTPVTEVSKSA